MKLTLVSRSETYGNPKLHMQFSEVLGPTSAPAMPMGNVSAVSLYMTAEEAASFVVGETYELAFTHVPKEAA